MAKSAKKKAKKTSSKKSRKSSSVAAECVSSLTELHKLQGYLLKELRKEV